MLGHWLAETEFLHVDDLARVVFCLENWSYQASEETPSFLNVGTGIDLSIKELATLIARLTGFQGEITWDLSKPDGTPRKLLDVGRINKLGWKAEISLETGIKQVLNELGTYPDFKD